MFIYFAVMPLQAITCASSSIRSEPHKLDLQELLIREENNSGQIKIRGGWQ